MTCITHLPCHARIIIIFPFSRCIPLPCCLAADHGAGSICMLTTTPHPPNPQALQRNSLPVCAQRSEVSDWTSAQSFSLHLSFSWHHDGTNIQILLIKRPEMALLKYSCFGKKDTAIIKICLWKNAKVGHTLCCKAQSIKNYKLFHEDFGSWLRRKQFLLFLDVGSTHLPVIWGNGPYIVAPQEKIMID